MNPCVTLVHPQHIMPWMSSAQPSAMYWGSCGRVIKVCSAVASVTAQPIQLAPTLALRGQLLCSCRSVLSVQPTEPVTCYQRLKSDQCACVMTCTPQELRYLLHAAHDEEERSVNRSYPNMSVVPPHQVFVVYRDLSPLNHLSFSPRLSPRQSYIFYCLRERVDLSWVNCPSCTIMAAARTFLSKAGPAYLCQARHVLLRVCFSLVYSGESSCNCPKTHIHLTPIYPVLTSYTYPRVEIVVWVEDLPFNPVLTTTYLTYVVHLVMSLPSDMLSKCMYRGESPTNRNPLGGVPQDQGMRAVWAQLIAGGIQLVPWTATTPTVTIRDTGDTKVTVSTVYNIFILDMLE